MSARRHRATIARDGDRCKRRIQACHVAGVTCRNPARRQRQDIISRGRKDRRCRAELAVREFVEPGVEPVVALSSCVEPEFPYIEGQVFRQPGKLEVFAGVTSLAAQ